MDAPPHCPAAASEDANARPRSNISHVVVHFSAATTDEEVNCQSESAKISSETHVSNNDDVTVSGDTCTENLVKMIKIALKDHTDSLYNELRQKIRRMRIKTTETATTSAGSTTKHDDASQPKAPPLNLTNDASPVEITGPLSVFVDITSIAALSALVSPDLFDLRVEDDSCREWRRPPCCSSQNQPCPLQALAAANLEWWDRPLWAWMWKKLILGHGAMISRDVVKGLEGEGRKWNAVVSTDKNLTQLPLIHWQCNKSCYKESHFPILVDPDVDSGVIRRILEEAAADTDLLVAARLKPLLERYGREPITPVNEECREDINTLFHVTQEDVQQADSLDETGKSETALVCTPETFPKGDETQLDIAVAEVTPQAERRSQKPPVDNINVVRKSSEGSLRVEASEAQDDACLKVEAPPSPSPQFDSSGVDITMLSQLPASVRSEARIAFALSENASVSKRKQKPPARGSLPTWFPRAVDENDKAAASAAAPQQTRSTWLTAADIDPETLSELPHDIQTMIQSELSRQQGSRPSRKRSGIASFFHTTGGKRFR